MKTWIGVPIVIATIVAPGVVAKALTRMQTDTTNSITITSVIGADSQAAVSGSYTIDPAYTFSSITVYVQPTGEGGGEGGEGTASTDGNGNFSALVLVPPNLTYDIQAMLTVVDGSGNPYYFFSDMVTGVFISSGPPGG